MQLWDKEPLYYLAHNEVIKQYKDMLNGCFLAKNVFFLLKLISVAPLEPLDLLDLY